MLIVTYRKDWYRTDEVAIIFQVHINTVRHWADTQKLPCIRLPSGHRRFALTTLLDAGVTLQDVAPHLKI